MNKLSVCVLLLLSIATNSFPSEEKESTVTLPIEVYRDYLRLKENPAVTTLSEIRISGQFKENKMVIEIRGESSKKATAKEFMSLPEGAKISGCHGNAMVFKDGSAYSLLPHAEKVQVTCGLQLRDQESYDLVFDSAVMDVQTHVPDAEVIEQAGVHNSIQLTLKKKTHLTVAEGKIVLTPRYHLMVKPDDVRFEYRLQFENPNPVAKKFLIPLANGEKISEIKTSNPNEASSNTILLNLQPGSSDVLISGQLPPSRFTPLFDSEEQYLLFEFHPLVEVNVLSAPPRIDIAQSGISPSYQAAMAFLIGKDNEIRWESKTREVFPSESFTALQSVYRFYIPSRGDSFADATFSFRNQGKPSLQYSLPGKSIFAAMDNIPQILTKTQKNELFLPLRSGETQHRIQYELNAPLPKFAGTWSTLLVKPPTLTPSTNVEVGIDTRHRIIALKMLSDIQFPWFNLVQTLWALFTSIGLFLTLRKLGVRYKKLSSIGSVALFFLLSIYGEWIECILGTLAITHVFHYRLWIWNHLREGLKNARPIYQKAGFVITGLVVIVLSLSMIRRLNEGSPIRTLDVASRQSFYKAKGRLGYVRSEALGAIADFGTGGGAKRAIAQAPMSESYLGLPVEHTFPDARQSFFLSEKSIPSNTPLSVQVFMISYPVSIALIVLAILVTLAPIYSERRLIWVYIRGTHEYENKWARD